MPTVRVCPDAEEAGLSEQPASAMPAAVTTAAAASSLVLRSRRVDRGSVDFVTLFSLKGADGAGICGR
jgi:hypothetical protein